MPSASSRKKMPVKTTVKKSVKKGGTEGTFLKFGKITVRTTNLGKLYWPEEQITKGDVISYYQEISKFILPYLKNRPQSLRRTPNGIRDGGFFQKDAGGEAPPWVPSVKLYSESTRKYIDYI